MAGASDRRKAGKSEDSGGAYWMDTYGDLVTLLLTFFVLLFAFSNIDAAKWQAIVGSFTGISVMSLDPLSPEVAMENPIEKFGPKGSMFDGEEQGGMEDQEQQNQQNQDQQQAEELEEDVISVSVAKMYQVFEFMNDFVDRNDIDAKVVLIADEYSVKMVFDDMVFFKTADANLLPESIPILDLVLEMFSAMEARELYELLRVEGHADKRPINTAKYPSNWDVSADRALHVISYFRSTGLLDNDKLVCVGYGETRPLLDEDTPEAYSLNRRVEFHVETLPQVRYTNAPRGG